ncbi:MAG: phosphoribosylaminoimidazolesuccinocarboxamide synthase [Candidatus Woesearchaeota archaeon]
MISEEIIKKQLKNTLEKTDFKGLGKKYEGKVRDNYTKENKRIIIVTDRISAFDRVLTTISFKGQVLNQLAAFWFDKTKHIVKNHMIEVPDPNVMVNIEVKPYPVEFVVRGYITGVTKTSAWYNYQHGVRNFCGNILPEGLKKDQKLPKPILTPTTKGDLGAHDESISPKEIVERGLISKKEMDKLADISFKLYEFGVKEAAKQGIILVDTKYEFGNLNGEIVLMDEIHTPDSSRFWFKDTYNELFKKGEEQRKIDKEYVRTWLSEKGFLGDGPIPKIPDNIKIEAAKRYIQAYELITGNNFEAKNENIIKRIEKNIKKYLE